MDTPVLAVRHVSKSFAGVRALVDIDLEIAPGEIHCLAGENGSGKSTLIKVISGVHTPEHGTVSIDGRDFTRLTPAAAIDAGTRISRFSRTSPLWRTLRSAAKWPPGVAW